MSKASASAVKASAGFGLETQDQKNVEDISLRIMALPSVQAALKEVQKIYRDDPIFKTPGAAANADEAARDLVYQTITYVVTEDPLRPKLLWTYNATRMSNGVEIPGTTFIESVDSVYRVISVGAGHRYEITGKRPKNGPAYITFEVWNAAQGLKPDVRYVTHLQGSSMEFGADGSFVVLVGPEPADGRANYLHTPEGGWIIIRESMSNWTQQSILENLQVRLLGAVDRPASTMAELEKRVIEVLPLAAKVNRTYMQRMFEENSGDLYITFGNKRNHLNPRVATRGGAWGYVTGTTYQIAQDQALLVTIATDDADYFAIQLHDAWGRTLNPIYLTNRNNSVSKHNADGTVTYVLSQQDPGVANWLDTRGIESGSLIMRWQGVKVDKNGAPAELVRDSRLVPLAEVNTALPGEVPKVSSTERQLELEQRKTAYEKRLR